MATAGPDALESLALGFLHNNLIPTDIAEPVAIAAKRVHTLTSSSLRDNIDGDGIAISPQAPSHLLYDLFYRPTKVVELAVKAATATADNSFEGALEDPPLGSVAAAGKPSHKYLSGGGLVGKLFSNAFPMTIPKSFCPFIDRRSHFIIELPFLDEDVLIHRHRKREARKHRRLRKRPYRQHGEEQGNNDSSSSSSSVCAEDYISSPTSSSSVPTTPSTEDGDEAHVNDPSTTPSARTLERLEEADVWRLLCTDTQYLNDASAAVGGVTLEVAIGLVGTLLSRLELIDAVLLGAKRDAQQFAKRSLQSLFQVPSPSSPEALKSSNCGPFPIFLASAFCSFLIATSPTQHGSLRGALSVKRVARWLHHLQSTHSWTHYLGLDSDNSNTLAHHPPNSQLDAVTTLKPSSPVGLNQHSDAFPIDATPPKDGEKAAAEERRLKRFTRHAKEAMDAGSLRLQTHPYKTIARILAGDFTELSVATTILKHNLLAATLRERGPYCGEGVLRLINWGGGGGSAFADRGSTIELTPQSRPLMPSSSKSLSAFRLLDRQGVQAENSSFTRPTQDVVETPKGSSSSSEDDNEAAEGRAIGSVSKHPSALLSAKNASFNSAKSGWSLGLGRQAANLVSSQGSSFSDSALDGFEGEVTFDVIDIIAVLGRSGGTSALTTRNPDQVGGSSSTVAAFPPPRDHPARILAISSMQEVIIRSLLSSSRMVQLLPPHPAHFRMLEGTFGSNALCGTRVATNVVEKYAPQFAFRAFVYVARRTVSALRMTGMDASTSLTAPLVLLAFEGRWRAVFKLLVRSGVPLDARCMWSSLCEALSGCFGQDAVTQAASVVDDRILDVGCVDVAGPSLPSALRLEERRLCFGGSGGADNFVRQSAVRSEKYGNICGRLGVLPGERLLDSDLPEAVSIPKGPLADGHASLRGYVDAFLRDGNINANGIEAARLSLNGEPRLFLNADPSGGISEETLSALVSRQLARAAELLKKRCQRISMDCVSYGNRVGTCYVLPMAMLPHFKTLTAGMSSVEEGSVSGVPSHNFVLPKSMFQRLGDQWAPGEKGARSNVNPPHDLSGEHVGRFSRDSVRGLFDAWRSSALGEAHSTSSYLDYTVPIYQPHFLKGPLPPPPRSTVEVEAASDPPMVSPASRLLDGGAAGVPFFPKEAVIRRVESINNSPTQHPSHPPFTPPSLAIFTQRLFSEVEGGFTEAFPRFGKAPMRRTVAPHNVHTVKDPFCVVSGPMGGQQQRMSARATLLCITAYCRLPKQTAKEDLPDDASYFFEVISADEQAHLQERLSFNPLLFRRKRLFDATSNFLPGCVVDAPAAKSNLRVGETKSYVHTTHNFRTSKDRPSSSHRSRNSMTHPHQGAGDLDTNPHQEYFKFQCGARSSREEGPHDGNSASFATTYLPSLLTQGGNASQLGGITTTGAAGFVGGSGGSPTTFSMGGSGNVFTISGSGTSVGPATFFCKDLLPSGAGEGSCVEYVSRDELISAVDYEMRRRGHPDVPSFYYDDEVFHSSESSSMDDEDLDGHVAPLLESEEEDYGGFMDPSATPNVAIKDYDEFGLAKLRFQSLEHKAPDRVPIKPSVKGRLRGGKQQRSTTGEVRHRYFRYGFPTDRNLRPSSSMHQPPPLHGTHLIQAILNPYRHRDVYAATMSQQARQPTSENTNNIIDTNLGCAGEGTSAVSHYAKPPPVLGPSQPSPFEADGGSSLVEIPIKNADQASSLFFATEEEWLADLAATSEDSKKRPILSPQALKAWPGSLRPLSKPVVFGSRGRPPQPPKGTKPVASQSRHYRLLPIWSILHDPSLSLSAGNRRLPLFPLSNEPLPPSQNEYQQPLFLADAMTPRTSVLHHGPTADLSRVDPSSGIVGYSTIGSAFYGAYTGSLATGVYQLPSSIAWSINGTGDGGDGVPLTGGAETLSSFATTAAASYVFYNPPTLLAGPGDMGVSEGQYVSPVNLRKPQDGNTYVFPYSPIALRFAPPSHMSSSGSYTSGAPEYANSLVASQRAVAMWRQGMQMSSQVDDEGNPRPTKTHIKKAAGLAFRQAMATSIATLRIGTSETLPSSSTEPTAVGSRILAAFKSNSWRLLTQSQSLMLHQLLMLTAVDNAKVQYITGADPSDHLLAPISYFLPDPRSLGANLGVSLDRLPFFPTYRGHSSSAPPTTSPWFRPSKSSDHPFVFQVFHSDIANPSASFGQTIKALLAQHNTDTAANNNEKFPTAVSPNFAAATANVFHWLVQEQIHQQQHQQLSTGGLLLPLQPPVRGPPGGDKEHVAVSTASSVHHSNRFKSVLKSEQRRAQRGGGTQNKFLKGEDSLSSADEGSALDNNAAMTWSHAQGRTAAERREIRHRLRNNEMRALLEAAPAGVLGGSGGAVGMLAEYTSISLPPRFGNSGDTPHTKLPASSVLNLLVSTVKPERHLPQGSSLERPRTPAPSAYDVEDEDQDSLPPPSDEPPEEEFEDAALLATPPRVAQLKRVDVSEENAPVDDIDGIVKVDGSEDDEASPPPSPLSSPWRSPPTSARGILMSPERRRQRRGSFAHDDALLPPGLDDEDDSGGAGVTRVGSGSHGVRFADPLTTVTLIAAIGRGLSTSGRKKIKKLKKDQMEIESAIKESHPVTVAQAERARVAAQQRELLKDASPSKPWWYSSKSRRKARLEADPRFCKVPYFVCEVSQKVRHPTSDGELQPPTSPQPKQHPRKKLRVYYRFFSSLAADLVDAFLAESSEVSIVDDREGHDVFAAHPVMEANDAHTQDERVQLRATMPLKHPSPDEELLPRDQLPNVCVRFPGKFTLPESHNYFGYFAQKMACVRDSRLAPSPSSTTTSLLIPRLQPSRVGVHTMLVFPLIVDSANDASASEAAVPVLAPTGAITKPQLQMSLSSIERSRFIAAERARRSVDGVAIEAVAEAAGIEVPPSKPDEAASSAIGTEVNLEDALHEEQETFGLGFGKVQRKQRLIRSMSKVYKISVETDTFSAVHLQRLEGTITQILELHTHLSHIAERLRRIRQVAIDGLQQVSLFQQTAALMVSRNLLCRKEQQFNPIPLLKSLEACAADGYASTPTSPTAAASPAETLTDPEHFWNAGVREANTAKVIEMTALVSSFLADQIASARLAPSSSCPTSRYLRLVGRLVLLTVAEWSVVHAENEERLLVDKFILALYQAQQTRKSSSQPKVVMEPGPAPSAGAATAGGIAAVLRLMESVRNRANELVSKSESKSPLRILHTSPSAESIDSDVLQGGWLSKFEVLDNERAASGVAIAVMPPSRRSTLATSPDGSDASPSPRQDPFSESFVLVSRNQETSQSAGALWHALQRDVGVTGTLSASVFRQSSQEELEAGEVASDSNYIPILRDFTPTWMYPINEPKLHHLRDQLFLRRLEREKRQWILTQEKFGSSHEALDNAGDDDVPSFFVTERWNSEFFAALMLHHVRSFRTVVERTILREVVVGVTDSEAQLTFEGGSVKCPNTHASRVHLCRIGLLALKDLDGGTEPANSSSSLSGFLNSVIGSSCDHMEKRIKRLEVALACRVFRLQRLKSNRISILRQGKSVGLMSVAVVKGMISKLRIALQQLDKASLEQDLTLAVSNVMEALQSYPNPPPHPIPPLEEIVSHLRGQQNQGLRSIKALYLSLPDPIRSAPQAVPPPSLSTSYTTTAASLFPQESFCSPVFPTKPFQRSHKSKHTKTGGSEGGGSVMDTSTQSNTSTTSEVEPTLPTEVSQSMMEAVLFESAAATAKDGLEKCKGGALPTGAAANVQALLRLKQLGPWWWYYAHMEHQRAEFQWRHQVPDKATVQHLQKSSQASPMVTTQAFAIADSYYRRLFDPHGITLLPSNPVEVICEELAMYRHQLQLSSSGPEGVHSEQMTPEVAKRLANRLALHPLGTFFHRLAANTHPDSSESLSEAEQTLKKITLPAYVGGSDSDDCPSMCTPVNQAPTTYIYSTFMHPTLVLAMVSQVMAPHLSHPLASRPSNPAALSALHATQRLVQSLQGHASYSANTAVPSSEEEKLKSTFRYPVEFYASKGDHSATATSSLGGMNPSSSIINQNDFWRLPLFTSPWDLSSVSRCESKVPRATHTLHEEWLQRHLRSLMGYEPFSSGPRSVYSNTNLKGSFRPLTPGLEAPTEGLQLLDSLSVSHRLKVAFFQSTSDATWPVIPCTFRPVTDCLGQGEGGGLFDDQYMIDDLRIEVSRLCATLLEIRKRRAARQAQQDCLTSALKVLRVCEALQFEQGIKFYSLFIAASFIQSFQLPQTSLVNNNIAPFPTAVSYALSAASRHRAMVAGEKSNLAPLAVHSPPVSGNSHSVLGHSAHLAKVANQDAAANGRAPSHVVHAASVCKPASGALDTLTTATSSSFPQSVMNPLARLGGGLGASQGKDTAELQEVFDVAPRQIPNPAGVFNDVCFLNSNEDGRQGRITPSELLDNFLRKFVRTGEKWPVCPPVEDGEYNSSSVRAEMEAARAELDTIVKSILGSLGPKDQNYVGSPRPSCFLTAALPATPNTILRPSIFLPRTTMRTPLPLDRRVIAYLPEIFLESGSRRRAKIDAIPPLAMCTAIVAPLLTSFPRADVRLSSTLSAHLPVLLQRPLNSLGPLSFHALQHVAAFPSVAPASLSPDHDLPQHAPQGRFDENVKAFGALENAWEQVNANLAL